MSARCCAHSFKLRVCGARGRGTQNRNFPIHSFLVCSLPEWTNPFIFN